MASGMSRFFVITQRGYKIRFDRSNSAMYLWIDPHESDRELAFHDAYLREGDFVVDVGANIGETVLTAWTRVGEDGSVMAFEPHPRTFRFLKRNLALNNAVNVEAFNLGLGEKSGLVGFTNSRREDLNRIDLDKGPLRVRVERLDNVVPKSRVVNLLKIDVEGFEKFVFGGAGELLNRTECIHFEVCKANFECFGYTTQILLDDIVCRGFKIFRMPQPGQLEPIGTNFEPAGFENVIGARNVQGLQRRTGWQVIG